jgi:hypothetical protein
MSIAALEVPALTRTRIAELALEYAQVQDKGTRGSRVFHALWMERLQAGTICTEHWTLMGPEGYKSKHDTVYTSIVNKVKKTRFLGDPSPFNATKLDGAEIYNCDESGYGLRITRRFKAGDEVYSTELNNLRSISSEQTAPEEVASFAFTDSLLLNGMYVPMVRPTIHSPADAVFVINEPAHGVALTLVTIVDASVKPALLRVRAIVDLEPGDIGTIFYGPQWAHRQGYTVDIKELCLQQEAGYRLMQKLGFMDAVQTVHLSPGAGSKKAASKKAASKQKASKKTANSKKAASKQRAAGRSSQLIKAIQK